MRRLLPALAAAAALIAPAAAQALPRAHPIDVSGPHGPPHLADPYAKQHVPPQLRAWSLGRGKLRLARAEVREQRFEDQHGHILTLATDNDAVDLTPYANLLASTYHREEIELVRVFVTSGSNLTRICGSDAAACYAADGPEHPFSGLMVISYDDEDPTHAVIHEYGHHIDNNTYNLGGLSDCGIDGDGSRRWFFARQMQDNILQRLSCDPQPGWGQLLPEVFAEDYAQLVGIPREEYHPEIQVRPPTTAQKSALRQDIDEPFAPSTQKVRGHSNGGRVASFRLRLTIPAFAKFRSAHGVKSVAFRGCSYPGVDAVFKGKCKMIVKTKRARQRFSFKLVLY